MTIWSFAVQDGNPGISQVVHRREGMHYVHWHTGCISAHPHGKAYTEILPVHSHWLSVPVQLGCLLLGIYQGSKVNLHVYLDYWLICASSPVQANLVLRVLQHLGWVIHFSKSDLPPGQQFNFICMQFSTCTYTVTPLPKMGIKIQNTLHHWRSHTLASPPGISTDFWACWPLWSP